MEPHSKTPSASEDLARLPWFFHAARASFVTAGALPWVLPALRAFLPMGPIGLLLDAMFVPVCHRRLERTLVFWDVPMPLCSRCAGIAAGLALGAIVAWPSPSLRATRITLVCATFAMLLDVVTQDLGVHPAWHPTRIATGLFFGYSFAIGLFSAIRREWLAPRT